MISPNSDRLRPVTSLVGCRRDQSVEDSVKQLSKFMFDYTKLNRRQRIIQRNRTERLADLLDWKNLGVYYRQVGHVLNACGDVTPTRPE